MAATGFTPISLYYTTTASAAPTAGNLVAGELAINTNDGVLYYKDSSGVVQSIASKAGNSGSFTNLSYTGTLTGGTGIVNLGSGQFYKDASGNVGIGTSSPSYKLDVQDTLAKTRLNSTTGTNETYHLISNTGGNFYLGRDNSAGTAFNIAPYASIVYSAGAYPMAFATNSTERMRIDSSGNVGIGLASTGDTLLEIYGANSATTYKNVNTGTGSSDGFYVGMAKSSGTDGYVFNRESANVIFGTANAERMRIDSGGNVLVGKTTTAYGTSGARLTSGVGGTAGEFISAGLPLAINLLASTGSSTALSWNSVDKGYINYNGTLVAITQVSDQRLKENIVDAPSAIQKINNIKIKSFDFKEDGRHIDYGVVAQELKEVVPSAVFEGVDDENGNIKTPWAVGLEPLIPILTKAIQEQQALIENLTTRLNALEGK